MLGLLCACDSLQRKYNAMQGIKYMPQLNQMLRVQLVCGCNLLKEVGGNVNRKHVTSDEKCPT